MAATPLEDAQTPLQRVKRERELTNKKRPGSHSKTASDSSVIVTFPPPPPKTNKQECLPKNPKDAKALRMVHRTILLEMGIITNLRPSVRDLAEPKVLIPPKLSHRHNKPSVTTTTMRIRRLLRLLLNSCRMMPNHNVLTLRILRYNLNWALNLSYLNCHHNFLRQRKPRNFRHPSLLS